MCLQIEKQCPSSVVILCVDLLKAQPHRIWVAHTRSRDICPVIKCTHNAWVNKFGLFFICVCEASCFCFSRASWKCGNLLKCLAWFYSLPCSSCWMFDLHCVKRCMCRVCRKSSFSLRSLKVGPFFYVMWGPEASMQPAHPNILTLLARHRRLVTHAIIFPSRLIVYVRTRACRGCLSLVLPVDPWTRGTL